MARLKIGVIISKASASYQTGLMSGITAAARENNADIIVFTSFSEVGMVGSYLDGERNVYELVNYDRLDGVLFVPDTLHIEGLVSEIEDRFGAIPELPVVYVDCITDNYPYVMTDDACQLNSVLDHLYNVHGYTDIAFVSGFREHPMGIHRLAAFRDKMSAIGLAVPENRVFYGDFWYDCCERIADEIISAGLPQAIMCASEYTAVGLIDSLEKRGISVPQDVAVTGYDSETEQISHYHKVTSIPVNSHKTGVASFCTLFEQITGSKAVFSGSMDEPDLVLSYTCGCDVEYTDKKFDKAERETAQFREVAENSFMMESLIGSSNLSEFIWALDWYTSLLDEFSQFSICLSNNWVDTENLGNKRGYSKRVNLVYTKINGEASFDSGRFFPTAELLPEIAEDREQPSVFYINPLHFLDRSFGYVVMGHYGRSRTPCRAYRAWLDYLQNYFESLRRLMNQNIINENNHKLSRDIISTQEQVILAFAEISESKSGQTGRHVKRVSEYSRVIAEGMGLSHDEVETVRIASMMHDIGKLLIPLEILEKPGKLTPEEFDVIKTHVTIGEGMLKNAPGEIMEYAKIIVLEHHERWDGTGYLGKKGNDISLIARIVAVADVFDALVSKRSYKLPWTVEEAFNQIIEDRGTHFAPGVVDAFIRNFAEIKQVLRSNQDLT